MTEERLRNQIKQDWKELKEFQEFLSRETKAIELHESQTDIRSYDNLLRKTLDLVAVIIKARVDAEVLTIYRKG